MVLLCAGIWVFTCLRKFQEKSRKIHAPGRTQSQKGARGQPGGPRRPAGAAPPLAVPGGRLGGSSPLWCPTEAPIYSRDEKTPEQKSFSQFPSWSRRHPLFFSGRANLEAVLASGEGRSSPLSSSSPLHPPSMNSPLMCE